MHTDTLADRLAQANGPVLVDGCPRCEEHADDPLLGLDTAHIEALWEQMLVVEHRLGREWDGRAISELDTKARRILWRFWLFLERHPGLAQAKLAADEARRAVHA